MKLIFRYMKHYLTPIIVVMGLKLLGTEAELMLPYILEHMIDHVVPGGSLSRIFFWGIFMILTAFLSWQLNVTANHKAVDNAHRISYEVRRDVFNKTINLSGAQFDRFGLPSLTSRMTSDSYNVQSFVQSFQSMCVRAPITMIGGIAVTMTMDPVLSGILCAMLPVLIIVIIGISWKGIPLFRRVQERLDDVVRVMRENITGIRVVKALSKKEYEKGRFADYNRKMMQTDLQAGLLMTIPGPFMQLCLNIGLTLVVYVGAVRVNQGDMQPGVILAFLTYFNMILQSVMALNRMFVMISKASASADRMELVLQAEETLKVLPQTEEPMRVLPKEEKSQRKEPLTFPQQMEDDFIIFNRVNFSYLAGSAAADASAEGHAKRNAFRRSTAETNSGNAFAGEEPEQCLYNISFSIRKGESLGIIGPTGCGKTTIINLLMRFYDCQCGTILVDGRDVRTYEKDELHRKFGVVFQNDMVFQDTLRQNIVFDRPLSKEQVLQATRDAMAAEYISNLEEGLDYQADIRGANLSGGQKQRLLISRALAADPEILILDDSSSALDYKTDAALRRAIAEHHAGSTIIMIAQRVSSIMNMTNILVMDNGHCIGYGKHEDLLRTCPQYRDIYDIQMGWQEKAEDSANSRLAENLFRKQEDQGYARTR